MIKDLVSIVSPNYNHATVLPRFLDSLLAQTYKKLHLIIIDDGSTDNTKEVIDSYIPNFQELGMEIEYHYQENGGLSAAINAGLQHVKGEFLAWPDSDDWFDPEAFRKRVELLKRNPQYGIVSCDVDFYLENDLNHPCSMRTQSLSTKMQEKQFELLLQHKSLPCPDCHICRTEAFLKTHPNNTIYNSREGQDMQMLLPLYYSYKRAFIDEPLAHYRIQQNSLSRSYDTIEKKIKHRSNIELLTLETLKTIDMPQEELEKYSRWVKLDSSRRRLRQAKKYKRKDLAWREIKALRKLHALTMKDWFYLGLSCL